jgi:hypothetical protein
MKRLRMLRYIADRSTKCCDVVGFLSNINSFAMLRCFPLRGAARSPAAPIGEPDMAQNHKTKPTSQPLNSLWPEDDDGGDKSWARTPGTYIAGRAYIDGADETAARWKRSGAATGCGFWSAPSCARSSTASATCSTRRSGMASLRPCAGSRGAWSAWQALDRAATAAGKRRSGADWSGKSRLRTARWPRSSRRCAGACRGRRGAQGFRVHARGDRPTAVELSRHRQGQAGVSGGDHASRSSARFTTRISPIDGVEDPLKAVSSRATRKSRRRTVR